MASMEHGPHGQASILTLVRGCFVGSLHQKLTRTRLELYVWPARLAGLVRVAQIEGDSGLPSAVGLDHLVHKISPGHTRASSLPILTVARHAGNKLIYEQKDHKWAIMNHYWPLECSTGWRGAWMIDVLGFTNGPTASRVFGHFLIFTQTKSGRLESAGMSSMNRA